MNQRESETLILRSKGRKVLNIAKIKVLQAHEKNPILWVLDTTACWNHKFQVSHEIEQALQQSQGLDTQLDS